MTGVAKADISAGPASGVVAEAPAEMKDDFIMSPKVDFAFKLLFGDERNKDLLIAFLSAVFRIPKKEISDVVLLNTELNREFREDRKGILDVRVLVNCKEQIDVEIQVVPTLFMPERTLFYWGKMYTGQIKSGEEYNCLKKCITINIVDFKCIHETNRLHTVFHVTEDVEGFRLTDLLEVHFLELAKLKDYDALEDDPMVL